MLKNCLLVIATVIGINMSAVSALAQSKPISVSGTVTDSEKVPLIGVGVLVQGTTIGSTTDLDGHFYIDIPSKESVLEFSCLGFKTQEIPVGSNISFNIVLYEDSSELDGVVVTGYGHQRRLSVIGSVETIDPVELQTGSTRSLSNNLAGQLAGVIAFKPSGEPGYDDSNFWIRGIASFSGNTSPLVLVDGVERNLNDIDPAEIESFSVLKDASASAMYGVRGANGVILINTKRGTVAPPSVDFRVEQSVQTPTKIPQFIGAAEYMALLNDLQPDPYKKPFTNDQILKTYYGYDRDLYPDTDWLDAITNDCALSTRANLTVSGGSEILRYSLTASYYHEDGIMSKDKSLAYDTSTKLNRYNIRANVDLDITKTTLLRVSIGGYMQQLRKSNSSTDEIFSKAFETPPFVHPAIYSDGTIPIASVYRSNPWAISTQNGYYRSTKSKLESLFSLEQNLKMITPGLKAKITFAFDTFSENSLARSKTPDYYSTAKVRDDEGNLVHSIISYGQEFLGHSSNGSYGNNSTYFEANVTYNNSFGKNDVDALLLYNQRSYDWGDIQPKRTQGIAGRLSYTYDRRYVAEFNFGFNGSENFAKGQRFGFFPSLAVGWLLSEEHFMEPYKLVLSKFKIRGSVGSVGNDDIGGNRRFAYLSTVHTGANGYNFGYDGSTYFSGVEEGEVGVIDLTWERSLKANVGLELGLWNALNLQVDVFKERRTNIFMQRSTIPTQTGFLSIPYANYGKVDNQGLEAQLSYSKRFNDNWSLSLRGTFTYAKNKIIEIDEPETIKGTYRSITGKSIGTLWGLTAERLYTADDFNPDGTLKAGIPVPSLGTAVRPGDIKYVDLSGDGKINDVDEGYIGGTSTPPCIYGFGGNLMFYGFDLNVFFQGQADTWRIIGGSDYFIPGSGQGVLGNVYSNYTDSWTEANPSQDVFWPRLSESTNTNNNRASTWWKKNMSFLRCKTIELGYTIPQRLTKKAHIENVRFYVSGNNLFYFSSFKLWDPELATSDGLRYPSMRSVLLGINIRF